MKMCNSTRLNDEEFELAHGTLLISDLLTNFVRVEKSRLVNDTNNEFDRLVTFLYDYRLFKGCYYHKAVTAETSRLTIRFSLSSDLNLFIQDFCNEHVSA